MNRTKLVLPLAFLIFCFWNLPSVSAQTSPPKRLSEPSYEVVLQTVTASNNSSGKSNLSPTLAGIVRKLKSDFQFSDYRLTSTFMQRVSNNGSVELKSVAYESEPNKGLPVFSEWSLNNLQSVADESGQETLFVQNFKFIQRVPVAGNNGLVTYEQVGLSSRFSLSKTAPTVVGSLTTNKPDELMFLILTVKPSEK